MSKIHTSIKNQDLVEKRRQQLIRASSKLFNEKGYSVGKADGLLGRGTRRALEKFQKDSNLATGGVTYETLGALNIEL